MEQFAVKSGSRNEMIDITGKVQDTVRALNMREGIVTVFCPHTTAGITINENADPSVTHDLLAKLEELIPKQENYYRHGEGNSDSHLKSTLTGVSEQVLVEDGSLVLGTWQGVYFCEFDGPRTRKVFVSGS